MFIAALSTIVKLWNKPKCPLTSEWIKEMWYIYTREYYAAIKKNEILPLAMTWIELESIMLSKISQTKTPYDFTHMWNLRNKTDEHRGREGKIK